MRKLTKEEIKLEVRHQLFMVFIGLISKIDMNEMIFNDNFVKWLTYLAEMFYNNTKKYAPCEAGACVDSKNQSICPNNHHFYCKLDKGPETCRRSYDYVQEKTRKMEEMKNKNDKKNIKKT